jgi:DMSO/TMAO reductase YedYZ molybdopterin-dependent catalytic subunit
MATEIKTVHPPLNAKKELARRSRRSFIMLGAGAVAGVAGWEWLNAGAEEGDIPPALRRVLGFNERVVRGALYSNRHLVKTFPASEIGKIKVNGDVGIDEAIDPAAWRLQVLPLGAARPSAELTLDDLRKLPRYEETIDFKCVEGWSTVTQFAGARLSDFTAKFAPGSEKAECVGMKTPDEEYYVSIDMPGALHPQSLLAWEMNGEPLTDGHGAPLRLVIPVKYGIKNIKRIGRIEYTSTRPADYWAERGYDWYAGL